MYRRLEIVTPLSPEDVRERLTNITRPRMSAWKTFEFIVEAKEPAPLFVGEIGTDTFTLCRDARYSNSHMPVIRGTIVADSSGQTVVRLTMSLPWTAAVTLLVVPLVLFRFPYSTLQSFSVLGVLLAVAWLLFYIEARKAERLLRRALGNS
jgi:hypothetical protein